METRSSHSSFVESQKADEADTFSVSNSELSFPAMEDSISQCSQTEHNGQGEELSFVRPVYENVSSFNPNDFESILLPPENKPLEMTLLKRAKELFTNNDPRTIAKHILRMDCKVIEV